MRLSCWPGATSSPKVKLVHAASAVAGLVAVFSLRNREHGGELVYSYAGGVGIRSGDSKDVERLLLAGLYHQAMADRKAGRADAAAELIAAAERRFPSDPEVRMLAAESLLLDRKDPRGAIEALASVQLPENNRVMRVQRVMLQADAYEAAGQKDAAVAALDAFLKESPNPRVQQRLDALKSDSS